MNIKTTECFIMITFIYIFYNINKKNRQKKPYNLTKSYY